MTTIISNIILQFACSSFHVHYNMSTRSLQWKYSLRRNSQRPTIKFS